MTTQPNQSQRIIDLSIEVNAPVAVVWRALTEAEELMRWFPPQARVEPGPSGSIFMSWGDGLDATAPIEIWKPNQALRLNESGMIVDYLLEARGQATVLRVVHSGFGADASFDDQYEGASGGWSYFLYNLKHYLERHRGKPRHMISARRPMSEPREVVWPRLIGDNGLKLAPSHTQPGSYGMRLASREFSGRIIAIKSARRFAGTVNELNDGLLFLELEPGPDLWHCALWLSVYGDPPADAEGLRAGLDAAIAGQAAQLRAS